MMHRLPIKLFFILFSLLPALATALPSDRDKPIEIEADHAQIDDKTGVTQYKGRAILTQGTLRIEGDIITFYYDKNKDLKKVVAQGKLAKYKQIHKSGESPVKARALQMEYHAQSQKIYLIRQGHISQNGDQFSGDRIEYDIAKNIINAGGLPPKKNGGAQQSSGRVHLIIQPPGKKKKAKQTVAPKTGTKTAAPQKNTSATSAQGYPSAVSLSHLNVRTGPGTVYNTIGTLIKNESLLILTEQKDWVQVRAMLGDKVVIGWVNRRYIRLDN